MIDVSTHPVVFSTSAFCSDAHVHAREGVLCRKSAAKVGEALQSAVGKSARTPAPTTNVLTEPQASIETVCDAEGDGHQQK